MESLRTTKEWHRKVSQSYRNTAREELYKISSVKD